MTSRAEDLEVDEPPTVEPYDVLGLEKAATPDQVKSAYRKAALKWHPDKVKAEDQAKAHIKFQEIALAYAVLSDDRRRARYDSTGRTDESLDIDDDFFNWGDFFRQQFADVVSTDSIAKFTAEYKGSDEERDALLAAYTKARGKMGIVYQLVMVSDPAHDDERFRGIINTAIEQGDVAAFDAFTNESQKSIDARIARADSKDERRQAEEYAQELGVHDKLFGKNKAKPNKSAGKKQANNDEDALAALIQGRQKSRSNNDFLANLEAKYAPKKKGKKRAEPDMDEPPEEAFEKTSRRAKKQKPKA